MEQSFLKVLVRSFYDAQALKIELGNRISAKGKKLHTLTKHAKGILMAHHKALFSAEKAILKDIEKDLSSYPIWIDYLKKEKGIAATMAGVIVSEIGDILRFATISKLWAYAGYGLYDGKIQRHKKGEKSNWNSFLKTKLHIVAEGFLRSKNPVYRKLYDDYQHRIKTRVCPMEPKMHGGPKKIDKFGCTKGHRHAMALRYIIKMFLKNLYLEWWAIEGKKPRPPYQEEYLGKSHGKKHEKKQAVEV